MRSGLSTGTAVLPAARLDRLARDLLGVRLAEVPARAAATLRCHGSAAAGPALVLHGASSARKDFESAAATLAAGGCPSDVPAYVETRAVSLAGPGDLSVGRLPAWRAATEWFGVPALDLGDRECFYLSHALLRMAGTPGPPPAPLARLLGWVAAHPDCVVRLDTFDLEMQLFLLWLAGALDLPTLRVEANDPVTSTRWNQKNHLHPAVAVAAALDVGGLDAAGCLARERSRAASATVLGLDLPVLPGYTVARDGVDEGAFVAGLVTAGRLLQRRYGLTRGCLKPSRGGGGAGIVTGLPLDGARLRDAARAAYRLGDDHLLEADVEFLTFEVAGRKYPLSPSGHVRGGRLAPGLTVQLLDGTAWMGNIHLGAADAGRFGIPDGAYAAMRAAVAALHDVIRPPAGAAPNGRGGLVLGGADFAVGRIGGRFGDRVLAACIDINLSWCGAEYLWAFIEKTPAGGTAATRVYRPTHTATLAGTAALLRTAAAAGEHARVVACVPGTWGMLAATGRDPMAAGAHVEALVRALAAAGLASEHTEKG